MNRIDKRLVRLHRCTLCNHLAHRYGNHARIYLSNEALFLYLLTNAQTDQAQSYSAGCTIINKSPKPSEALEYASAIAVMLAYSRLLDAYYDTGNITSRIMHTVMRNQAKHAEKILKSQGFDPEIFSRQIIIQHKLEKEGKASLRSASQPSSTILGAILAHSSKVADCEKNRDKLIKLGMNLGALLYALDGYSDIEQDFINNRFNPFLACRDDHAFRLKTPEIIEQTRLFCHERLTEINQNLSKIRLHRYKTLINHSLKEELTHRVNAVIKSGETVNPPPHYLNMLLPFTIIALKAIIGQGEGDGDMYDCCVWCCCEDEDPCAGVCPEPLAHTGEPLIDYAVRTLSTGGGAAVTGVGAGIIGSRLLKRRPEKTPEPEDDMIHRESEFVEPKETRIIDIPDELPEIPELDKDKFRDSEVDPSYLDKISKTVGESPPPGSKQPKPPEITSASYPENPDDGVARAGMDHWDVWEWLRKNRGVEFQTPETKPVFIDEKDWKSDDEHWFWKKMRDLLTGPSEDYHSSTPEEKAAKDAADAAAGKKARELGGAYGGKSPLTKALSDPTNPDEGNPKTMLEQALRDRIAQPGVSGVRMTRGLLKSSGAANTKQIIPNSSVPHLKNLGLSTMRATEEAKKIGQGIQTVRDLSGVADGGLDLLSQTNLNPLVETISPDATTIIDKSGVWQVDQAQQEAINRFVEKHGIPPKPSDPSDVEEWKNMLNSIRRGE